MKKLFGDVDKIEAEGITGEYGFVTLFMTEKEFAQKSAELPGFISRIRLEEDQNVWQAAAAAESRNE